MDRAGLEVAETRHARADDESGTRDKQQVRDTPWIGLRCRFQPL